MKTATAYIDLKALRHNLQAIRQRAPGCQVAAVVKADAYGHGLCRTAAALQDAADAFAVARTGEGLALRDAGIVKPIMLLEGFFSPDEVTEIASRHLDTAVHDDWQVTAIERAPCAEPLRAWLQTDVGMHRLGSADLAELAAFKARLEACPWVRQPVGLISHLSVADTPSEVDYHQRQMERFRQVAQALRVTGPLSLANSAAVLAWPEAVFQWVRPGIILYGISPFADRDGSAWGLQPAQTFKTSLLATHRLRPGDKVGYGAAFTAPRVTVLGIVAAGYGDGYPRAAPAGTPVLINGRRVPTVGHVCMDMMFVDLGPDAADPVGSEVTLWGQGLPAETVAAHCGTIAYELVCRIMPRVARVYLD